MVEVGPEHANPPFAQCGEHLAVRVPEQVAAAAGDDRQARRNGVEEGRSGGAPAAVMCDFQDVRMEVALDQPPLRLALDVAGEQDARPFDLHAQHDRRVVLRRAAERVRHGMRFDADRAEVRVIAVAHEVDRDGRADEPLRAVAGEAPRREPELVDVHAIEHGRQSAAMIGMGVREEDRVEVADAVVGELRQEERVGWTSVDQDGVIAVPDGERVALADVEGDELRSRRMMLRDRGYRRDRHRGRHQHRAQTSARAGECEQCGAEANDQ